VSGHGPVCAGMVMVMVAVVDEEEGTKELKPAAG
jgi:hypothetical protein